MIRMLMFGLLSAWITLVQPNPSTSPNACNKVNGNAPMGVSSAQGSGADQALVSVLLGSSQTPANHLHEYQVGINLSQPLAAGATVTADFSAGWVQGSNSYGYATLNATRDKITVHYKLPSCGNQSGYGLVAEILVDNKGADLDGPNLASDGSTELIILIQEE
jgi:hypothetical protein